MSFLDDIKSRLPFGQNQDDYGQDGYDEGDGYDEYYDDGYQDDYQVADSAYGAGDGSVSEPTYRSQADPSNGVLGQTRRGEAESVAVYTRSGQLVGDADRHGATYNPPARSQDAYRPGAYDTPSTFAASVREHAAQTRTAPAPAVEQHASSILSSTPQLPAYVLRPESYDDVETVVRRVRTKQPVALVFVGVRTEVAKRVLDFSYGFACGLGASVKEVGDRVFMVLPAGCEVKQSDLVKLRDDGYLK
ncbi:cell division protein SepF [Enorma burkinafasonensis]|uniref:cell division protein SepF n=1 Tax=Enorma burkinafasonensis TaxID=2590867 RepID=UPI0026EF0581|nr:cell division protein SepF [Enorma burkinafasonensis]MCI7731208.1 cell division protein SepF [Enorma burkinafasonensis]